MLLLKKLHIGLFLFLGLTNLQNGQPKTFDSNNDSVKTYHPLPIEIEVRVKEKHLPFGLTAKVPADIPRIGIALSGGGSRGFSHIGFLEALEKADIPIDFIVGTSMGSIIGGLYSAGYDLKTLKELLFHSDWNKFTSRKELKRSQLFVDQKLAEDRAVITFRLDGLKPVIPTSISSGQSISSFLNSLVINAPLHVRKSFDELLFRFRAVSTNLVNGKEVVIDKGSLTRAMRASSSVSFFLPPVEYDSLLLVDGGLVANIPALITRRLGSDVVFGSNATSPLRGRDRLRFPWEVAEQLVSIPMERLTTQNLQVVDLLVEPDLEGFTNNDFTDVDKIYLAGKKAAFEKLNEMREVYKKFYKHKFQNDILIGSVSFLEEPNEAEKILQQVFAGKKDIYLSDISFALSEMMRSGKFQYLSAAIDTVGSANIIHVKFRMNEAVKEISVIGSTSIIDSSEAYEYFSSLKDKPFSPFAVLESSLKLLRSYRNKGYSLVEISSIKFIDGSLVINVNEHPVKKIIVKGNNKTNEEVIIREFSIREGEPLKINVIKEGLLNLQATNLFSDVEAEIERVDGNYNLLINVIEKSTNLLRLGLRIDNENFTQVFADLREENLFGSGTELGIIFGGGTRGRSFVVEQKSNRVFDSYLTYKIRLYHRFQDVNVYKDDSTDSPNKFSRVKSGEYRQIYSGFSIGVGTQAKKFGNLIVEGRYESNEIKNKTDYTGEVYRNTISAIKFSLFIDSQNKMPFPTEGFLINSYYETAQKSLGSEIGYTKFLFDYKSYFTYNNIHTISPRFILGFADETLPLSQQFSLGGQYSFFGLRNDEYRGRQLLASSLEYRAKLPFKIFFDTYIKFRYDLGSIWEEQEAIRFKDLRHAIGATISFDTPLGQADFSVGRSFYFVNTFNKNSIKRGPIYFYFTIGY